MASAAAPIHADILIDIEGQAGNDGGVIPHEPRANPAEPAATITSYIVQVALGDLPHGSIGYQSIFAAGLVLMIMTLVFNLIGFYLTRKFREAY